MLESDAVDSSVSSEELLEDEAGRDLYLWAWWAGVGESSSSETSMTMTSSCARLFSLVP